MDTHPITHNRIEGFFGPHRFLSNFWPATVVYEGVTYPSVEHAYQAAKTLDPELRDHIRQLSAGQAKRYGGRLTLRPNWHSLKREVMRYLVHQKFHNHPEQMRQLLDTGNAHIEETNTWGDTFWGVCDGVGENHLGEILMRVRTMLRNDDDTVAW